MNRLDVVAASAAAHAVGLARTSTGGERLPLAEVVGRVLAEPLVALVALPGADTVAMDGWAVAGDGPWQLEPGPLAPGRAVVVATGSVVPPGTAALVRREDGTVQGDLLHADALHHDVRPEGEQCRAGDVLLPAGSLLGPAAAGLAAAAGHDELVVVRRPRVAALMLGDEVVAGGLPAAGQVRDAVGPQLASWCAGAELLHVRQVADRLDLTTAALRDAAARADVVVVCGGTSVGERDHLRAALHGLGAELVVDGVDVRPGHPMLLARLTTGAAVVGLPGNPLAAAAGATVLLAPLLAGLAGRPVDGPVAVVLAVDVPARSGAALLPVHLGPQGATPLDHDGPAMLRGLAQGHGLALVGPGPHAAGEAVPVHLALRSA